MTAIAVSRSCQKHQVILHYYGGSSEKRCHECERDEQLDRIERKLGFLLHEEGLTSEGIRVGFGR